VDLVGLLYQRLRHELHQLFEHGRPSLGYPPRHPPEPPVGRAPTVLTRLQAPCRGSRRTAA
jgi:hypothetical protein